MRVLDTIDLCVLRRLDWMSGITRVCLAGASFIDPSLMKLPPTPIAPRDRVRLVSFGAHDAHEQ
jgi:hypothetical protein